LKRNSKLVFTAWLFACLIGNFPVTGQTIGKPEALLPSGPSPRYPLLRWESVPGADEYKIRLSAPGDIPCPPNKSNQIAVRPGTGFFFASATSICRNDICELQYFPPPPDKSGYGAVLKALIRFPNQSGYGANPFVQVNAPIILRPRDCQGNLKIAKWSVRAVHKGTEGPESNELSFYWADNPPSAPSASPSPSIEVTCVFKSGNHIAAVFYGAHWSFLSWPQFKPNPAMIGKVVTIHPQPLRNCSPDAGPGLTPIGETKFRIEHITYRDANPEATNVDGTIQQ
jgi:hypothetical protein